MDFFNNIDENSTDEQILEYIKKATSPACIYACDNITSVQFRIKRKKGKLLNALKLFAAHEMHIVAIEFIGADKEHCIYNIYARSDKVKAGKAFSKITKQLSFIKFEDVECSESDEEDSNSPRSPLLKSSNNNNNEVLADETPWFPISMKDLDECSKRVLLYGNDVHFDYPGYTDEDYKQRRMYFGELAMNYKSGDPIPVVEYTQEETMTWKRICNSLWNLYPKHACKEFLKNWHLLINCCGYSPEKIPQLENVNKFLKERTGFILRPVAGYLSPRDFLYCLAFRVFNCTQYIRHPSNIPYTPEPDCCHELLGHIPMLADANFANFSQELGLASIGASEEDIKKLATLYFFTIEFGLCRENNVTKAYGAGLLSSDAELQHAVSENAVQVPFDPEDVCNQECLITTFQKCYYISESFIDAKQKIREFASTIKRPFPIRFDPYTQTIEVMNSEQKTAQLLRNSQADICVVFDAMKKFPKNEIQGKQN